jgi:hypothetical protein
VGGLEKILGTWGLLMGINMGSKNSYEDIMEIAILGVWLCYDFGFWKWRIDIQFIAVE